MDDDCQGDTRPMIAVVVFGCGGILALSVAALTVVLFF
jgi:hypothetical protein